MSPSQITAITAWPHRSSNEKIRQYGREVTFRGERTKLKDLVKDLLGEAIDDSWEWVRFTDLPN